MRAVPSPVELCRSFRLGASLATLLCVGACAEIVGADFDDLLPLADAGRESDAGNTGGRGGDAAVDASATGGTSGADAAAGSGGSAGGGNAGTAGVDGSAGMAGADGSAGSSGTDGSSGTAGLGGSAGRDGSAGAAGTGGDGGPSCEIPRGPGRGDPNRVVINEVYAEGSTLSDYVELLNTNSEVVDVSRLKVGDEACTAPDALVFPSETFMEPGGYIVIRGNQASISGPMCCPALFGAGAAAVCFNTSFGVSADGETVSFCSADNIVVDEVAYPGGLNNVLSYARSAGADAGANFTASTPTPGTANR